MATSTTNHVTAVLDELEAALDAALQLGLRGSSRGELAEVVCRVEGPLAAKMAAFQARVVVEADDAVVGPVHGVRTTDQLVSAHRHVDPARVRADGRLGRWLEGLPILAEAFHAGAISREHLECLRKADNLRVHRHMVESQATLLESAQSVDWRDWDEVVRFWLLAADPDGSIPRAQLRNRRFSMAKQADGSWSGTFRLDAVSGQMVRNAVAMEEQRLLDLDTEHGITRSAADRQADAFVRVVGRGAARESGDLPAPVVHVVIGQKLAEDMVQKAIDGDLSPLHTSHTDVDRRCEMADGTPIHPNMAMAVLAVAKFKRLVLAPSSRPLDLGRSARGFPRDIRLALLVAARGRCRTPGCDAPFAWLQADHIHAWSRNGDTEVANGQGLCRPDNRHKGAG